MTRCRDGCCCNRRPGARRVDCSRRQWTLVVGLDRVRVVVERLGQPRPGTLTTSSSSSNTSRQTRLVVLVVGGGGIWVVVVGRQCLFLSLPRPIFLVIDQLRRTDTFGRLVTLFEMQIQFQQELLGSGIKFERLFLLLVVGVELLLGSSVGVEQLGRTILTNGHKTFPKLQDEKKTEKMKD